MTIYLTNFNIAETNIRNGGGNTKYEYNQVDGTLSLKNNYQKVQINTSITASLPQIIPWNEGDSTARIDAIKDWFLDKQVESWILGLFGFTTEEMQTGGYMLAIEPIAYFRYEGYDYAMTATEAALFDQAAGGGLSSALGPLTRQNLPLATFLETDEFDGGMKAWDGTKNSYVKNSDIIKQLGIGFINYNPDKNPAPAPKTPEPEVGDGMGTRTYPTSTYVVISVRLCNVTPTGNNSSPWASAPRLALDSPASVTFKINGTNYVVNNIYIPKGGEQLVFVKWKTPATPQNFNITVTSTRAYKRF